MRAAAGLHRHQTRRLRSQKPQQLAASQLLAKHGPPSRIGTVQPKILLGQIQTNRANLIHGRILFGNFEIPTRAHQGGEGASTPSMRRSGQASKGHSYDDRVLIAAGGNVLKRRDRPVDRNVTRPPPPRNRIAATAAIAPDLDALGISVEIIGKLTTAIVHDAGLVCSRAGAERDSGIHDSITVQADVADAVGAGRLEWVVIAETDALRADAADGGRTAAGPSKGDKREEGARRAALGNEFHRLDLSQVYGPRRGWGFSIFGNSRSKLQRKFCASTTITFVD